MKTQHVLDRHGQELLPVVPCARARRASARFRRNSGTFRQFDRGMDAAPAGRPGHDQHGRDALGRLGPKKALALFADWTDRIAAGELPFAKPERPQGVERNVVISMWEWSTPQSLSARCDLHRQAQSARERQRPDLRVARGEHRHGAGARSASPTRRRRSSIPTAIPRRLRRRICREGTRAYWGDEADLGRPHQHPQSDHGREGARVVHRADPAGRRTRLSARRARIIRRRRSRRSNESGASALDVRSEDRQVVAHRHLLHDAASVFRQGRRTTRCGPAPAARKAASSAG